MSKLFDAIKKETVVHTTNGAITLQTTKNELVDLFFVVGASRGKDIRGLFHRAYTAQPTKEHRKLVGRMLLWLRDIRGGAGERETFRTLLKELEKVDYKLAKKVLKRTSEVGRWDDLLYVETPKLRKYAFKLIGKALEEGNGLCAKWMPRKGAVANELRKYFELTPKQWRRKVVDLTNVVETQMCNRNWKAIEYDKIPSVASSRYAKAFGRNDTERYVDYLGAVEKGTAKINASAIFPYDVIKGLGRDTKQADLQWQALPDYVDGSEERMLPVVDVSGSMTWGVCGDTSPLQIAISLGLYLSERSQGVFQDKFITFSSTPSIQEVKGTLYQRYQQMKDAHWGMSTNIQATFDLILDSAVQHKVPEKEMPTKVLILSDMEFDRCGKYANFEVIEAKYNRAGYKMPELIFWNLNAREGNNPVEFNKDGVGLVSGFSPSLVKSILACKNITPMDLMLDTIMDSRYDI